MIQNDFIRVFGFGSHFVGEPARDVDILIIHDDIDRASCGLAISCKNAIKEIVDVADITILSKPEEKEKQFISTCKAVELGTVRRSSLKADVSKICDDVLRVTTGATGA